MIASELYEIIRLHKLWLLGDKDGKQANLRSADLQSANLQSANLQYANLQSANLQYASLQSANLRSANLRSADLRSADLRSAKNTEEMYLDTGERLKDYLAVVVPALLRADGKTIKQIVANGAWQCHTWENCPMADAFGVHKVEDAPMLLQPRIRQFVQLFDAGLIPCPVDVEEAENA